MSSYENFPFSLIHLSLEVLRRVEIQKHIHTHTPSFSSYQDPYAIGLPVCNGERFQTAFLTPDGFVQTPWKPHTPQIHRHSASSSEEEETLTPTLSLSASDVFISPPLFVFHLTCNICCSSVCSFYSYIFHFVQDECNIKPFQSVVFDPSKKLLRART